MEDLELNPNTNPTVTAIRKPGKRETRFRNTTLYNVEHRVVASKHLIGRSC